MAPAWPGGSDPQALLTEPRAVDTRSHVPLPLSHDGPRLAACSEVPFPDPRGREGPGRVSTVAGWAPPRSALLAGSGGCPLCLDPGGWGASRSLVLSVSKPRAEPRCRPLDGSSVVVKPGRPQAQRLREAVGEETPSVRVAAFLKNSHSCCPKRGPRNYLP